MTLVVDASVAARWFLPLEKSDVGLALLNSGEPLIAPDLIIPELVSTAWKATTFGNAPVETSTDFILRSSQLFHEIVPSSEVASRALKIALELKHPAYDCFYLALAELRECRLVTADERLVRRCAKTPFAKLINAL
jgi:predicted nucleic acid-binding protein